MKHNLSEITQNEIDEAVLAGRITPEIREAQARPKFPQQQSQLETYDNDRWRKDATELLKIYLGWNPETESLQYRLHKVQALIATSNLNK